MRRGRDTPSEIAEANIRDRLADMASGDPLPPVRVLAAELKVSPATITKAMRRLKRDGLIGSRPGWSVFKA
jgi:GntR family transcriptional regulator, transcriptional repressor for pyruvate dehydrogenase complex